MEPKLSRAEIARLNGKKGGRPRKPKDAIAKPVVPTPEPTQPVETQTLPALENPHGLSPKELLFVEHYFASANFSASKAYELAGFKPNRHNAARLITKENVAAAVAERMAALVQQARKGGVMDGEEAMERLSLYARADISLALPEDDPIRKLPDEIRLCIKSIRETKYGRVIELHDSLRAAENMAKAAGRLKEQVEVSERVPLFALPAGDRPDVSGAGT